MLDLGEDFSFVAVTIAGVEQRLDAFDVCDKLRDVLQEAERSGGDGLAEVCRLLKGLGYPEVGKGMADRFAVALFGHVKAVRESLKKKDGSSTAPGSPASTDSPPSA